MDKLISTLNQLNKPILVKDNPVEKLKYESEKVLGYPLNLRL